ncbi:hypothetical protein E2320_003539 [Naja naja]|nr:hypothetical protein E2320_003539 [Naja naja]
MEAGRGKLSSSCCICQNFSFNDRPSYFPHKQRVMQLLLLVFLMNKVVTLSSPPNDAFLVPHDWYQPGDLIIGGMLTYGSFAQEEFQTTKLSSLYCMVPNEDHQYTGIIQLLVHFKWTWIGVFTLNTNKGERFFQKLQSLLSQNDMCIAFSQNIPQLVNLENVSELLQGNSIIHMDDCFECSEDHYPNKEKIECIVKPVVFLNIEEKLGIAITKFNQHVAVFTVKEINENPRFLTNIAHGSNRFILNYKWCTKETFLGIIGALGTDAFNPIAEILSLYKFLQLPYGSFPPKEFHISNFSFYFMAPNEGLIYIGIIRLLQHFGWKWVGLFAVENESGEHFLKKIQVMLSQHGICPAFIQRISLLLPLDHIHSFNDVIKSFYIHFTDIKANIFILYGESYTLVWMISPIFLSNPEDKLNASFRKVWITTSQVDFILTGNVRTWNLQLFDGTISFQIHSGEVPAFKEFLKTIKPFWRQRDGFLKGFWEQAFDCPLNNSEASTTNPKKCTGEENLDNLPGPLFEMQMTGHSYSIYNGIYIVAHSLQALLSKESSQSKTLVDKIPESEHLPPFEFLCAINTVILDIGRENPKRKPFVAMIVFPVHRGRFQARQVSYKDLLFLETIAADKLFCQKLQPLLEDFWAVDVLFFLVFPVIKVNTLNCPEVDPFPILHEWYQPGDLLIGGLPYGSFPPKEFCISNFSFYFMAPNEGLIYIGIIQLLQHFGWKWVGLFAVENESGEHFLKKLKEMLSQHGICPAFIEKIPLLLSL